MAKKKDIETCFNYCSRDEAFFSSNEEKWINRIRKLQNKFPDEVFIIKQPEVNDGTIYAKMPCKALSIKLQKAAHMTEAQIAKRNANLKKGR